MLVLRITANSRRKHSRIAVIVSKKVHKSAVGRNRMRRRVYEVLRQEIPCFNGVYDCALIITSSELLTIDHETLVTNIHDLLYSAGVYQTNQQ